MKATTHYGYKVTCIICKNEDLEGFFTHIPANSSAIDQIDIGYCSKHRLEAEDRLNKYEREKKATWNNYNS